MQCSEPGWTVTTSDSQALEMCFHIVYLFNVGIFCLSLVGVSSLRNLEWLNLSGNTIKVSCYWKCLRINLKM